MLKYLDMALFNLDNYGFVKTVGGHNYKHNCLQLALHAGGFSYFKLQQLMLTYEAALFITVVQLMYVMLWQSILALLHLNMDM